MTPAEIAASLTKAQAGALLLVPDHQRHMRPPCLLPADESDVEWLHELKLIARWHDGERSCWINPLGLAVRAILKEQGNGE